MQPFLDSMNEFIGAINGVIWADWVLYVVLGVGVLFTLWSGFCRVPGRWCTAPRVTAGKFDDKDDPGRDQPLPGPVRGAVRDGRARQHRWRRGRDRPRRTGCGLLDVDGRTCGHGPEDDLRDPLHDLSGRRATRTTPRVVRCTSRSGPSPTGGLAPLGMIVGVIFCITLLISAITGGNMFQAWNVGVQTEEALGIPAIGRGDHPGHRGRCGDHRRYQADLATSRASWSRSCACSTCWPVASSLLMNIDTIPSILGLIVQSAFSPTDAGGARSSAARPDTRSSGA